MWMAIDRSSSSHPPTGRPTGESRPQSCRYPAEIVSDNEYYVNPILYFLLYLMRKPG